MRKNNNQNKIRKHEKTTGITYLQREASRRNENE